MLASMNDEGVVLIEEGGVTRQALLEERADLLVRFFTPQDAVAFEDAASVGIDYEDKMLSGVKKNGVRSFRADAVNSEQLFAQFRGGGGKEFVERALIAVAEKANESLQLSCLLPKVAGRADQTSQMPERNLFDRSGRKEFFAAKRGDGPLNVGPTGVLGQDGADDDFKAGAAGPPMLRPQNTEECIIIQR